MQALDPTKNPKEKAKAPRHRPKVRANLQQFKI